MGKEACLFACRKVVRRKNNFPAAFELSMQLPEQLLAIYAVMKGFEKYDAVKLTVGKPVAEYSLLE